MPWSPILTGDGRLAEACTILETAILGIPAGWKPSRDDEQSLQIAFWDQASRLVKDVVDRLPAEYRLRHVPVSFHNENGLAQRVAVDPCVVVQSTR